MARQKDYFAKARVRAKQKLAVPPSGSGMICFVPSYIPQKPNSIPLRSTSSEASRRRIRGAKTARSRLVHLSSGKTKTTINGDARVISAQSPRRSKDRPAAETDVDFRSKRQKLLHRNDWAGVEVQKPLPFESLWNSPRVEYTPSQWKSHIAVGGSSYPRGHIGAASSLRNPNAKANLRVRIGSQHFRWSQGSNSLRSRTSISIGLPSQMDDPGRSELLISPNVARRQSSSEDFSRSPDDSGRQSPHLRKIMEGNHLTPAFDTNSNHRESRSHSSWDPYLGTALVPNIAFASPPELHHPQPQRLHNVQTFLEEWQSSSPELDDSVIAQVDHQEDDQDHFRKGNMSEEDQQDGHQQDEDQSLGRIPSRSLSPGVSHYWSTSDPSPVCFSEMYGFAGPAIDPYASGYAPESNATPRSVTVKNQRKETLKPSQLNQLHEPQDEDEEKVWKKFVLDDDASEIDRIAHDEAHVRTTRQLRLHTQAPASDIAEPSSTNCYQRETTPFEGCSRNTGFFDIRGLAETSPYSSADSAINSTSAQLGSSASPPKSHKFIPRFHRLRPFVGRLAGVLRASSSLVKEPDNKVPRVWKKKKESGRLDIRGLPDIEGDPIEDSP